MVSVNDKLKLIKTAAIIGPSGAGKSFFVLVVLEQGDQTQDSPIGIYTLVADREKIFEESMVTMVGRSKRLMFE